MKQTRNLSKGWHSERRRKTLKSSVSRTEKDMWFVPHRFLCWEFGLQCGTVGLLGFSGLISSPSGLPGMDLFPREKFYERMGLSLACPLAFVFVLLLLLYAAGSLDFSTVLSCSQETSSGHQCHAVWILQPPELGTK